MKGLKDLGFYQEAMDLWDYTWSDSDKLMKDLRGKEIARQVTRSVGSISANIEEGYGRGFGKEYPRFLKIARGSAQESRGWYLRSKSLLEEKTIDHRVRTLDKIIAMLSATINTLSNRSYSKKIATT